MEDNTPDKIQSSDGLRLLRAPFNANQISKLPKPYKKESPRGKCDECGGYHGLPALHLDYVGHAATTDRLLDADVEWNWEPLCSDERGMPLFDSYGGLWIRLTVCGITRLGYGDAQGKSGPDAIKECIGDALRNAAMRFGVALDLWHKGTLHVEENEPKKRRGAMAAAEEAKEKLTPARQEILLRASIDITELTMEGKAQLAYELCEEVCKDNEEKMAIWSFLDSKVRASLKAYGNMLRNTPNEQFGDVPQ